MLHKNLAGNWMEIEAESLIEISMHAEKQPETSTGNLEGENSGLSAKSKPLTCRRCSIWLVMRLNTVRQQEKSESIRIH
jgi:hypothetical protein